MCFLYSPMPALYKTLIWTSWQKSTNSAAMCDLFWLQPKCKNKEKNDKKYARSYKRELSLAWRGLEWKNIRSTKDISKLLKKIAKKTVSPVFQIWKDGPVTSSLAAPTTMSTVKHARELGAFRVKRRKASSHLFRTMMTGSSQNDVCFIFWWAAC